MPEKKIENTKKSFEIRSYKPDDENAICALFESVFGKPMGATESICHWRWEYVDNSIKGTFIKLAWDNEKLVGQYAASPVRLYADGREILAALSHDTMTDPQYRGLGIFTNTAEALYNDQKNERHNFIYGFPNRNSIHGFKKNLNWHQIMPAPVHIRPVRITTHLLKRQFLRKKELPVYCHESILLSNKDNAYKLRVEPEFGDWADDLWQRCRSQHRLWVVRDKIYLNWRYVSRPESKYNIVSVWRGVQSVGYVVTTYSKMNFGNTVFVLDFMVDINFQDAAETLIRYILNLARVSGAAFASALLPPGSRYRNLFRSHLFMPLPEQLFPQPLYFGARCFVPALNDIVFDPKAWSISWGDNDVL